jgi:hypothetical protein
VWEKITITGYANQARYSVRAGWLNPHFLDAKIGHSVPLRYEMGRLCSYYDDQVIEIVWFDASAVSLLVQSAPDLHKPEPTPQKNCGLRLFLPARQFTYLAALHLPQSAQGAT